MGKTLGSHNFYSGSKNYCVREVIPYIRKNRPDLDIPESWTNGGTLNHLVSRMGIEPTSTNGLNGSCSRAYFSGTLMFTIAKNLIAYLDEKKRKKQNKPKPVIRHYAKASDGGTAPIATLVKLQSSDNNEMLKVNVELAMLLHERARIDARIFQLQTNIISKLSEV